MDCLSTCCTDAKVSAREDKRVDREFVACFALILVDLLYFQLFNLVNTLKFLVDQLLVLAVGSTNFNNLGVKVQLKIHALLLCFRDLFLQLESFEFKLLLH